MSTRTLTDDDVLDILKEVPLHIEEPIEEQQVVDDAYTRIASPLLLDQSSAQFNPRPESVQVILNSAPLFATPIDSDTSNRSVTRAIHSVFQSTPFWNTFFNDAYGSELNSLILFVHNFLRYPYINEVSIIFDKLLTQISRREASDIEYEITDDAENIILQRLAALYKQFDYRPALSLVLDTWVQSQDNLGLLRETEVLTATTQFRLQDLRNELIRRKFAGSSTAYSLIFRSIGRRGSFYSTFPLSNVEQASSFVDDRLIRAINLPGVTTVIGGSASFDPISVYEDDIRLRTLLPLFYEASGAYTSEGFWSAPDQFLRVNSENLAWDNLRGIAFASQTLQVALQLDSVNPVTGNNYVFDEDETIQNNEIARLDDLSDVISLTASTTGFVDIEGNEILYSIPSLQRRLGETYPFYVEPTANGVGPHLIDLPWLRYVEEAALQLSRASAINQAGVQLSVFEPVVSNRRVETFFSISFNSTQDAETSVADYIPGTHEYVFLWNVVFRYNELSFIITSISPQLLTVIKLPTSTGTLAPQTFEDFGDDPSFGPFTNRSVGLAPFRYTSADLTPSTIPNFRLLLNDASGLANDLEEFNFAQAFFRFTANRGIARSARSEADIATLWSQTPPDSYDQLFITYAMGDIPQNAVAGPWSEPIPVHSYTRITDIEAVLNVELFRPDWKDLIYHLSPLLSLREASASPLRRVPTQVRWLHPTTEVAEGIEPTEDEGIGEDAFPALRPANITHQFDTYLNNTGGDTAGPDLDQVQIDRGSYLELIRPDQANVSPTFISSVENYIVLGDNRGPDPVDLDASVDERLRTLEYVDSSNQPALLLRPSFGFSEVPGEKDGTDVQYYLTNNPEPGTPRETWVWDDDTDGMALFFELGVAFRENVLSDTGKQYLAVRKLRTPGSNPHAEFEWYIDFDTEELVYRVFPTGYTDDDANVLGEFTLEIRGDISDLLAEELPNRQTLDEKRFNNRSFFCGYRIIPDEEFPVSIRRIEMHVGLNDTILASKFVGIEQISSANPFTYNAYELASFDQVDITTGTPILVNSLALITIDNTVFDYEDGGTHFLGDLFKNGSQPTNDIPKISLFSLEGYDPFFGTIYDIRFFNTGRTALELQILGLGSKRSLFSYSPGLYKTAAHTTQNLFLIRRGLRFPELAGIGIVRVFRRSVFDSISIDNWIQSFEESDTATQGELFRSDWRDPVDDRDIYQKDQTTFVSTLIAQTVSTTVESGINTTFAPGQNIQYRSTSVFSDPEFEYDILTTSLYPFVYENRPYTSGLVLEQDSVDNTFKARTSPTTSVLGSPSVIPAFPSGDTLEYSLEFRPSVSVDDTIYMGSPLSGGAEGTLRARTDSYTGSLMGYIDPGSNTNLLSKTHALYPLMIPEQEVEVDEGATLGGFTLTDFRLSQLVGQFLSATNYYQEFNLPFAQVDDTTDTGFLYSQRTTAVRVWREGTYYFTVKFPVQVRPLGADQQPDRPINYLAFHFKIEVTGRPKNPEAFTARGYAPELDPGDDRRLDDDLLASQSPVDNRDFRFRQFDIDLFTLEQDSLIEDQWDWLKVASNYDTSDPAYDSLSEISSSEGFSIQGSIKGYFTTLYKSPFFTLDSNYDFIFNRYEYPVTSDMEDTQRIKTTGGTKLLAGRTYYLLFDHRGETTEFGYTPETYGGGVLSSDELNNYFNHASIFEPEASREARYRFPQRSRFWFASNINTFQSGFTVTGGAYPAISTDVDGNWLASLNTSLGDPYSTTGTENALINRAIPGRRDDARNISYFFYTPDGTDVPLNPRPFTGRLPLVRRGSGFNIRYVRADELRRIRTLYRQSLVQPDRARRAGISRMAWLNPLYRNVVNAIDTTQDLNSPTLRPEARNIVQRFVRIASTTPRTFINPPSENLIQDAGFDEPAVYSQPVGATFVYDATEDDDVYQWTIPDGDTTSSLTYILNLDGISGVHRATINIYVSVAADVAIDLLTESESVIVSSTPTSVTAATWTEITFTTTSAVTPRRMRISITGVTTGGNDQQVRLDRFELRRIDNRTDINGFSSAYNSTGLLQDSAFIPVLDNFKIVGFGDSNLPNVSSRIFPIQFLQRGATYPAGTVQQEFFEQFRRRDSNTILSSPFNRQIRFLAKTPLLLKQRRRDGDRWVPVVSPQGDIVRIDNSNPDRPALQYSPEEEGMVFGQGGTPEVVTLTITAPAATAANATVFDQTVALTVQSTAEDTATEIETALQSITTITDDYTVTIDGAVITLTAIEPGNQGNFTDDFDPLTTGATGAVSRVDGILSRGIEIVPSVFTDRFPSSLQIASDTLTILNERFSLISNAVNPRNFELGIPSEVAFSNVQLLSTEDPPRLLYEIEFPPVFYDETKNHLSLNLLFRKQ